MTNLRIKNKAFLDGIYIDSKLRREILTGENSGKITIGGRVEEYVFENLGGGVYKCRVSNQLSYTSEQSITILRTTQNEN